MSSHGKAGGSLVMNAISHRSRLCAGVLLVGTLQGCATATVRGGYCAP
jgi:hypothetical protein